MGQSKRQRKDSHKGSLRQKGIQQEELALDLLSDELKEQLLNGSSGQEQLLILPGTKQKGGPNKQQAEAEQPAEPELTKSQLRKLRQVQMKKERRENIAQVLTQLNTSSISDAQLALLRPLHQRGARETKKQRLRRSLQLQRAGVQLNEEEEAELFKPRKQAGSGDEEGSDKEADSEDSEQGNGHPVLAPKRAPKAIGPQPQAVKPTQAKPTPAADTAASGSEDDAGSGSDVSDAEADAAQVGKESDVSGEESEDDEAAAAARSQQAEADRLKAIMEEVKRIRAMEGITMDIEEDEDERAEREAMQRQMAAAAEEAAAVAAAGGEAGKRHRVVQVTRPPAIETSRQGLPILTMEQEIVESVAAHDVVVLCGETGCGKTTQVPQFLLEAGYGCTTFPERAGCIGVTQPRRVAATSTAARVAEELGSELGSLVGYQVRYDRAIGSNTRIKFMTDGILLRELQDDFLLKRYSVLLVDEAHERSLNTDLLLGMLSRIAPLRRKLCLQQRATPGYDPSAPDAVHPLKVIIMSATLRTSDFVENQKLFKVPPPVIEVPARQYPVTVHFSRRTEMQDYESTAYRKVLRIHRELPPGGVLVFLTGQREVEYMCKRLRTYFEKTAKRRSKFAAAGQVDAGGGGAAGQGEMEVEVAEAGEGMVLGEERFGGDQAEAGSSWAEAGKKVPRAEEEDDYDEMNNSEDEDEEDVQVLGGESMTPEEIAEAERRFEEQLGFSRPRLDALGQPEAGQAQEEEEVITPVHVLPLYAMLPAAAQARVFEPTPPGHRLIVVATNVAETSLTIPGIRYVVDAGRSKQRLLEAESGGMARFEVRWVSQAASAQRAGRAGRTGPGHCYRLFSSAHFNDSMPKHTPPEIANTALEGVLLVLKSMGVDKVQNFPFPSPPERSALKAAEECLIALSALDAGSGALTDVGRAMAAFPIGPRHARMLLEVAAWQLKLAGAASAAAAAAGSRPPTSKLAAQTLPFAIALAAALTVDSPFMHLENLDQKTQKPAAETAGDSDDGGGQSKASNAEDRQRAQEQRVKQQQARAAHSRLRCGSSDALSALKALIAFESAGDPAEFCTQHYLHLRTLSEAKDLHKQLIRILQSPALLAEKAGEGSAAGGGAGGSLAQRLAVLVERVAAGEGAGADQLAAVTGEQLSTAVQDCLRRAVAVGWADSVARRVRTAEYLARQQQQHEGKQRAIRYVSCALSNAYSGGIDAGKAAAQVAIAARTGLDEDLSGDVYLHPRSALHSSASQYVAYTSLVRTAKRPYMGGVTAIEPEWLVQGGTPLASWSQPLMEPEPFYKQLPTDAVMAWHDVTYGRHDWPMPRCVRPHPDVQVAAAVFAAAFLDGKVVTGLSDVRKALLSPPAVAARPEMVGVARVGELVGALARQRVSSCAALCRVWAQNPNYLQREVTAWLPKSHHAHLAQLWPGFVRQAVQAVQAAQAVQGADDGDDNQVTRKKSGKSEKKGSTGNASTGSGDGNSQKRPRTGVAGRDATQLAPEKKRKKQKQQGGGKAGWK